MVKSQFIIADPYNPNHIDLYKGFEQENSLPNNASSYLEMTKNHYQQEIYKENIKNANEISMLGFLLSEQKIIDTCVIKIEKDRKIAHITYLKQDNKRRKIIPLSTNYVFNALEIEEVFVSVNKEDTMLINDLEYNSFEPLGIGFDNNFEFIKEKEYEIITERKEQCK